METRTKITLGDIVLKAGAGDLPENELLAVLTYYVEHGPEPKLAKWISNKKATMDD